VAAQISVIKYVTSPDVLVMAISGRRDFWPFS
jgi:hypothetical protein